MVIHISARLAWHDSGWNGCICSDPKLNVSCLVHEYIRDSRDEEFEQQNAGNYLSDINFEDLPPCSRDSCTFSSNSCTLKHSDPLDWRNLPEVEEEIPQFSFCTSPYGRMFKENGRGWEDDPEKQLENLQDFWKEVEPSKSLIFFYSDHGNPLEEDKTERLILGVGCIKKIGKQLYFGEKKDWEDDYPLWSRCITQNFPEEGVRIPYQEYLTKELDLSSIICKIPKAVRSNFSYVAEHVPDDVAIGVLERIIQSIANVLKEELVPEPYGKTWEYRLNWLNDALGDLWTNRGLYPGIGSALEFLGFKRGMIYHRKVLLPKEQQGQNIFEEVFSILEGKTKKLINHQQEFTPAIKKWQKLSEQRKKLLMTLSRFNFSTNQIKRLMNPKTRKNSFITNNEEELIENPYLFAELDDGDEDSPPIDFETIDRGMIFYTDFNSSQIKSLEKDDRRRIRALIVDILREAGDVGHTILSIDDLITRISNRLPDGRKCNVEFEIIPSNIEFYNDLLSFHPKDNPVLVALKKYHNYEQEIRKRIIKMVQKEYEPYDKNIWEKLLKEELEDIEVFNKTIENTAREEKLAALKILASSWFSVLTGRAGTGKTTVLKILIKGLKKLEGNQQILLLAPTGKSRVKLQDITGEESKTIHQILMKNRWIRQETYSLKEYNNRRETPHTVIIDESSMIPIDLLGTLFRAIDFNYVRRLILVGDPNQLPPIGPGRPFFDIIKWLDSSDERRSKLVKLEQRVRHRDLEGHALQLADFFLSEGSLNPANDEILCKIAKKETSGDLEVFFWTEETLHDLISNVIQRSLDIKSENDYKSFNDSLKPPDFWQILSPTRMQISGSTELNRLIQLSYRKGLIEIAKRKKPRPFGDQQIVWFDKVIQIVNSVRKADDGTKSFDNYIANGEIGIIENTGKRKRGSDFLDVIFSTQQCYSYRYYRNEVDENLELAYAITVHKSQGSDFNLVLFIIPQSAGTLSKELLYTGITRYKEKLIILMEKDIRPLITYSNPQNSAILKRNTNLFEPIVISEPEGLFLPEYLIHRTKSGIWVRSKSEVIVSGILDDLGISYEYEKPLYSKKDPLNFRIPDFTMKYEGDEYYWEHLGMLSDSDYKKAWKRKKEWYKANGYHQQLVTSKDGDDGSIDCQEIIKIAKERILNE